MTYSDITRAVTLHYGLEPINNHGSYLYQRGKNFILFQFSNYLTIHLISDRETIACRKSVGKKPLHRELIDAYIRPKRYCSQKTALRIISELNEYPHFVIEYCDPQMFDILDRIIENTKGKV